MTSVPRETQLMVTIQRAASLPARMARSAVGGTDDKRLRRGAGVDRRRGGRAGGDGGDEGGGGGGGLPSGAPDRLSQQRNCFVEVGRQSHDELLTLVSAAPKTRPSELLLLLLPHLHLLLLTPF